MESELKKKMQKLTDKQQAFVDEYCSNGYNGHKAAVSAGYSVKTALAIAAENLSKPIIKQAIRLKQAEIQDKTDYDREQAQKDYEQIHQLAIAKGDLQAANTAIRGKNKLYALEVDKLQTDQLPEQRKLTEKQELEAAILAKLAIEHKLKLVQAGQEGPSRATGEAKTA